MLFWASIHLEFSLSQVLELASLLCSTMPFVSRDCTFFLHSSKPYFLRCIDSSEKKYLNIQKINVD